MELPIKNGKVWKTGSGSYVLTIPKDYINQGMLEEGDKVEAKISKIPPFYNEKLFGCNHACAV